MVHKDLHKIPSKLEYTKYTLKNGLEVVLVPVKNVFSVDARLTVRVGSQYEKKEINGIAHFLEHMNFKGTKKKPEHSILTKEIDENGGIQNAATSYDYTSYYAHIGFEYLESILDFLSDIFTNSIFPEKEFEKEKGVIIEEIRMYEDDHRSKAEYLMIESLYGDQPAGWNIAGPEKVIANLTQKEMVDFYKKYYHPKNALLIIAGNFDKEKTKKLIKKYFEFDVKTKEIAFPKAKIYMNGPEVNFVKRDVKETHFVLGFNAFSQYDKREPALQILNALLSDGFNSRLYLNVREKLGGAYYVTSDVYSLYDRGIFSVSAGVNTEKSEEILKEIIKELNILKNELVNEKELDKVKNRLVNAMIMGLDNPYKIIYPIYNSVFYKNKAKSPKQLAEELLKVTSKDVRDVSRLVFKPENIKMGVVGSKNLKTEFGNIIKNI